MATGDDNGGLRIDAGARLGVVRGPLPAVYSAVQLPARISTRSPAERPYALDFGFRPMITGTSRVSAVEVTYQAGMLRTPTAVLRVSACMPAWDDWRPHTADTAGACDRKAA